MSAQMWRIVLAVVVGAHGIGHVLFLMPLLGIAEWEQSGRSWLLGRIGGDVVTRIVGSLIWLLAIAGFVAVAVGLLGQLSWWREVAIGSALVSMVGLLLFWSSPVSSSTLAPLVFDVVVLLALLVLRWPPASLVGS